MSELKSVDWDRLLEFHRSCLYSKLSNYVEIPRPGDSEFTSAIVRAESVANPIATALEQYSMSSSFNGSSKLKFNSGDSIKVSHPVSGETQNIENLRLDGDVIVRSISEIPKIEDNMKNFLAYWRLWPSKIEKDGLPSSLFAPDNSLTNHVDMTSGIWVSQQEGEFGTAYLSFQLGPVQPFIESARSVRDLWTGSAILSWLTFKAMLPVLENFGPTAIVFPSLRGNPQMDFWLRNELNINCVEPPDDAVGRCPSIPNKFVALVPFGENGEIAENLARICKQRAQDAWIELADEVHDRLDPRIKDISSDWSRNWTHQIENVFEFETSVIPESKLNDETLSLLINNDSYENVYQEKLQIRKMLKSVVLDEFDSSVAIIDSIDNIGRWELHMDYSRRVMDANRRIRHVPESKVVQDKYGQVPYKCSQYGYWEQMGPSGYCDSKNFWNCLIESFGLDPLKGVRISKHEKFCAVALTKRFAAPLKLSDEFNQQHKDMRFQDTATIAALNWLNKVGIDPNKIQDNYVCGWNGLRLHEINGRINKDSESKFFKDNVAYMDSLENLMELIRDKRKKNEKPPSYYAILKMDGDKLSDRLGGKHSANLSSAMHSSMLEHLKEKLSSQNNSLNFGVNKPLCPATHSSISSALGNFASNLVPRIVKNNKGVVIYSGGDDLLVFLPASNAMNCACELRKAYRSGNMPSDNSCENGYNGLKGMGDSSGISASIVYVHYMEDLRLALKASRETEKFAKDKGRDIANLKFMKRSGVHSNALLPWSNADWFCNLTNDFIKKASNRWAYKLNSETRLNWFDEFDTDALTAEILRIGNRTEDDIWKSIAKDRVEGKPGDLFVKWWQDYCSEFEKRKKGGLEEFSLKLKFEWFTLLCLGATFVARGRDVSD